MLVTRQRIDRKLKVNVGLTDFERRTTIHCEKRERMITWFGREDDISELPNDRRFPRISLT